MPTSRYPSLINGEIRDYPSFDVLRAIAVGVPDGPALPDVQPTFVALAAGHPPHADHAFDVQRSKFCTKIGALLLRFVPQHCSEAVERPAVEVEVALIAPVAGLIALVVLAGATEVLPTRVPAEGSRHSATISFDSWPGWAADCGFADLLL